MRSRLFTALVAGIVLTAAAPAPAQSPQNPDSPVVAKVKQLLSDKAQINAVQVADKTLSVAVNDRGLSTELYLTLVAATCSALGTDAKQFKELAFGNRFADEGYVFKAPAKCAEILKMPSDKQVSAFLADTDDL
jgi:hypothetical protein